MGFPNDLASLDATAQAQLVPNGEATATELLEATIEAAQRWWSRRPPVSA